MGFNSTMDGAVTKAVTVCADEEGVFINGQQF